ncbi:hypothetical protein EHP00_922 [Ecytonucleospora hepatopenaei]|uniref:Uncharacterized protein n=1 Tax=Ecytonucleospora hepatopenaei TaxID=646526 RepID=A0A1W0E4V0_9MICR|nr:hypothetical protein EHP00_922 [Ecytonucleospora hepatopenaei]
MLETKKHLIAFKEMNVFEEKDLKHNLHAKYNLVGVKADKITNKILKYNVDFIELSSIKNIKKSLVNICKQHNIFIKVNLSEYSQDKLLFCGLLKKLLVFRAWRIMVITDDFLCSTRRVMGILEGFGFKRRNAGKIVENEEKMCKNALLKRYAYQNTFLNKETTPTDVLEIFY